MSKLRRTFKQKFDQKAGTPTVFSGMLGNGFGVVSAGEGKVYVRIAGSINQAICSAVPFVNNLPVWVGYTAEFPDVLKVLGQQPVSSIDHIEGVGKHANQHEWMGAGVLGGTDVLKVHLQQFLPLMVMPYSGLQVMVYPGISWTGSAYKLIADTNSSGKPIPQIIDLANYVPSTDKEKYVLIGVNTSGSIEVVDGVIERSEGELILEDIPEASPTMIYKLAAVRRYDGQIEIVVNRETVDIVDLRFPIWRGLAYDEIVGSLDWGHINFTGSDLADLETKSHTALTDIGTNTHGDIDGFISSHSHTESDITDLDHDAQKIKGIPVLITGIQNNQILKYNTAETRFEPADQTGGGGSGGSTSSDWTDFIDGALVTLEDAAGVYIVPRDCTIEAVMIHCKDQGSASSTIIDINLNGTTIFTTQANRPELTYDDADGIASGTPDVVDLVAGDMLTIDIDQVATDAESLSFIVAMTVNPTSIGSLDDVDLTGIVDGNVLIWDDGDGKFIAGEGGGGADILEIQVFN